ncbi:MAG TPA: chemotaxis protein CheA [Steroidobacteraceae bacterium]|jgi:two-component system chemotaxis sensor kinase CheA|nr:chemotaxis protein CheA [Steroidobacteraceae bacterium]
MTLDLTQFHDAFFEESFEALDSMESALLKLDLGAPDAELINTIFRVAHSIKGGSATFGFSEIASFTHSLETLLDELRANRLQVTEATSDLLLKSVDAMRDMLRAVQAKKPIDSQRVADLQFETEQLLAQRHTAVNGASGASPARASAAQGSLSAASGGSTSAAASPSSAAQANAPLANAGIAGPSAQSGAPSSASAPASERRWKISFRPYPELFARGNDPLRMLRELHELGSLRVEAILDGLPSFAELDTQSCYLAWNLELSGNVDEAAIRQVFDWAEGDCDLVIAEETATTDSPPAEDLTNYDLIAEFDAMMAADAAPKYEPVQPTAAAPAPAAMAPAASPAPAAASPAAAAEGSAKAEPTGSTEPAHAPERVSKSETAAASGIGDSGSIRVSVEKIDELMNTVGELVITQSMLSQLGRNLEGPASEQFRLGLAELERNMRELQDSVMRVRMLPISFVFSRFPRMVRDLAQRLGKQIELTMTGEQTELDKTVLEKIGDPLVHLIRNSIDHGIEKPEVRVQRGKTPVGHLRLDACHRGGNICVEVHDDGAGLDPQKIMAKARARGLIGPNETLSDDQAVELIFMPGFSTAEQTTDVSGRGVGLDVVRRNVKELGGSIDIRNSPGQGARFIITLPLTLAIVDGQSIAVGKQNYIVPLISIIESLQIKQGSLNRIAGRGEVFAFRGDYVPVIRLHELFGVEPRARELDEGLIVIVEGDGRRVGLFVDDLLGQQQVVIKSLETNYGHIDGVSGATILGDGSVALILDLPGIIRRAGAGVRAN